MSVSLLKMQGIQLELVFLQNTGHKAAFLTLPAAFVYYSIYILDWQVLAEFKITM